MSSSNSSHPATYRAAQIQVKDGPFELVDIAWKDPQAGQVVVKIIACGVCHGDASVVHQHMPTGLPRIPGHEIVGTVAAVPDSETRWKVGDRVGSGWHGGHCHTCVSCLKGDFNTCSSQNINGIKTDGGYAEYATLRTEALLSVPEDIDAAEAAPLLCAGLTTFNSLRNMDLSPGDIVAVQGVGGLGHLAIQFARNFGYHVVALSSSPAKEALARQLGAHDYLDSSKVDIVEELQKMGGAKVALAMAPSGAAMASLLGGLAVGGQIVMLAVAEPITLPMGPMVQRRLQVRGWPSGSPIHSEETIAFAKLAGIKTMVERYPLAKVNEAFQDMMEGKARFRAVLTFE